MIIDFLLDDIRKAIAELEGEVSGITAESFASVDYVSSAKTIYFYNAADEEVGSIDTTDFVVDGMIDTVSLSGNVLHFVFNTDAGKQPIDVDLSTVIPDIDQLAPVAELPASAETGTVVALYKEGEAGGGTWEGPADNHYTFNCDFSTLDTAQTYDIAYLGQEDSMNERGDIYLKYLNGVWNLYAHVREWSWDDEAQEDIWTEVDKYIPLTPIGDAKPTYWGGYGYRYDRSTDEEINYESQLIVWDGQNIMVGEWNEGGLKWNDISNFQRFLDWGDFRLSNIEGGSPTVIGVYQYDGEKWNEVGGDGSTKLLAVNELPATAEPGTVVALYQKGEGGGTWVWDEASEEYVFNCDFSTLDTAATYDLGSPLGGDVSGCFSYGNINLHYYNGWKVTTNYRICDAETDEQACENQGGTWNCNEEGECNCLLYRTIELSPSTDPNNGFGSSDICYDYDEGTGEETERPIQQRFYWDPADLKLKYVMIDDSDEVTHYRYDCSGVPDLKNISGATEPILDLYQYDGTAWNKVIDLSGFWTSAQTKDYVDSGFWTSAQTKTYVDSAITEVQEQIDSIAVLSPSTGFSNDDAVGSLRTLKDKWAYWDEPVIQDNSKVFTFHTNSLLINNEPYTAAIIYDSDCDAEIIEIQTYYGKDVLHFQGRYFYEDIPIGSNTPTFRTDGDLFTCSGRYNYILEKTYQNGDSVFVLTITPEDARDGDVQMIQIQNPVDVHPSNMDGVFVKGETSNIKLATEDYVDSASTVLQDQIDTLDEVVSEALVDLNERIGEISGSSVDLSGYYTSGETDAAISAATRGKADAANVTSNTGRFIFPKWNSQGIITGVAQQVFKSYLSVNDGGSAYFFMNSSTYDTQDKALKLYTPLSAGTAGDVLVSTGNGAPVWSALTFPDVSNYVTSAQVETQITSKGYATVSQIPTVPTSNTAFTNDAGYITSADTANMVTSTSVSTIWKGTQAEYDAIVTKDASTLYIIVNNS